MTILTRNIKTSMPVQTITIGLPQNIYQRLQRVAQAIHCPVEEVMFQSIRSNLPPSVEDLPAELRSELAVLQNQSDQDLWAIARATLPPAQWRRHKQLLRKNQTATLTGAEREELTHLRTATDNFVFRRSYALALLKWRGYTLPMPLSQLHDDSAT